MAYDDVDQSNLTPEQIEQKRKAAGRDPLSGASKTPEQLPSIVAGLPSTPPADTPLPPPTAQYKKPDQADEMEKRIAADRAAIDAQIAQNTQFYQEGIGMMHQKEDALRSLQESIRSVQATRAKPPELIPLERATPEQLGAINQLKWVWPAAIGIATAIAGMIGKHKGFGIGQQFFLGAFMQSYAKGYEQQQKHAEQMWWKQVELDYKTNEQRLAQYRAQLSDSRFDMATNMQLFKTYADLYGDSQKSQLAGKGMLNELNQKLTQDTAANRWVYEQAFKTWKALDTITHKTDYQAYFNFLNDKFKEENGRYPVSWTEQKMQELKERYTPNWWFIQRHNIGGRDETGKTRGYPSVTPQLTPDTTDAQRKKELSDAADEFNAGVQGMNQ